MLWVNLVWLASAYQAALVLSPPHIGLTHHRWLLGKRDLV